MPQQQWIQGIAGILWLDCVFALGVRRRPVSIRSPALATRQPVCV